jgi:hypothetical protein
MIEPFIKRIIPFRCLVEETNRHQLQLPLSSAKITTTKSPICCQQGACEANRGNCSSPTYSVPAKMPCNAMIDWCPVITAQNRDLLGVEWTALLRIHSWLSAINVLHLWIALIQAIPCSGHYLGLRLCCNFSEVCHHTFLRPIIIEEEILTWAP